TFALTTLAVLWARMAAQTQQAETAKQYPAAFLEGKRKAAEHFFRLYAPEMEALLSDIKSGKSSIMDFSVEEF
ncbi:acyl-CoA dehydrogenase C-terminal domain-containing protein, partial [Oleiphilus sp. HI0132]